MEVINARRRQRRIEHDQNQYDFNSNYYDYVRSVSVNDILPGNIQLAKGITVGIVAWFSMMIGPMPMSGSGLFGLNVGIMVPVMTLVFHLVFGMVLGLVFKALGGAETTT